LTVNGCSFDCRFANASISEIDVQRSPAAHRLAFPFGSRTPFAAGLILNMDVDTEHHER
jgi:hypothetical protein